MALRTNNMFVIGRNCTDDTCIPEGYSQASMNLVMSLVRANLSPCVASLGSYPLTMDPHIRISSLSGLSVVTIPDVNYPSFLHKLKTGDLLSILPILRFLMREYGLIYLLNVEGMYFSLISRLILRIERRGDKIVKHLFNSPVLWNLSARFIKRGIYDYVLCTSRSLKRHLSNIIDDGRVHYVPYPINTESFQPRDKHETRKLLELPPDVNIVGYVGHITVERGAFDLIKAFSKLSRKKDVLFVVVAPPHSETKVREEFVNLTRRLNLETRIINKVTSVELFYNAVDVLALPFRQTYLPIDPPVTIVEALSSGTPLITTPVGAIKEVVNEERGLLVKPGNVDMLKDALEYLLSDEKARQRLGLNAREYVVKNLSLEVIGRRIKGIFKCIL